MSEPDALRDAVARAIREADGICQDPDCAECLACADAALAVAAPIIRAAALEEALAWLQDYAAKVNLLDERDGAIEEAALDDAVTAMRRALLPPLPGDAGDGRA